MIDFTSLGISFSNIPIIITALLMIAIIAIVLLVIYDKNEYKRQERKFDKQLRWIRDSELDTPVENRELKKFLSKLSKKMYDAEMSDKTVIEIRRMLMTILGLAFVITLAFSNNVGISLFPPALIYGGLHFASESKLRKKRQIMDEQIPAFVSTFKANIQANIHSKNALISAIDNTAYPLYGELEYSKAIMEAGSFESGIRYMRLNTHNDTLRQMASCIEIASDAGANLEEQIEVIEQIIEDKSEIERKKRIGVNENRPLMIASLLFIPGTLFAAYFMNEIHRSFWFKTTLSWAVVIGITIIMGIGFFAAWRVIEKIDIG